ncbi:MAG TPA: alpha-glucan family phosphorylase [Candidatus Binataceae bacterium]|nr:alpha-glucan family phosphorylase [Candidatus Binataceae bacterium]
MASTDYTLMPHATESVEELAALALDLRNCWDHGADQLWSRLEPELWALTHNPWVVLQTVSRTKLTRVAADPAYRKEVQDLLDNQRKRESGSSWFERSHRDSPLTSVAYFSMEFGLSEALPIYSGGLGNVAGDQLKAANDLGVPVVGIGLLYQQGYFRQFIDADGNQTALNPYNDPSQLPISPVRDKDGEWLRLEVRLPGQKLWVRTWQAQVGRVMLYLLDSNDPANPPAYRGVTSELYGGGPEIRLQQELVLGIGGWRLLRGLGMNPEVCHLNEGHAAFAVLERARSFMDEANQPFDVALAVTRAGNLFTTHTPVSAGFDRFAPALMEKYLKNYAENLLHIGMGNLMALGRLHADAADEPFNVAYLALRGSGAVNGVSRLHGTVSREIFQPLFPRWPQAEVPVSHVTNGVHTPTWDSPHADKLWTEACGSERWRGTMDTVSEQICCATDTDLWRMRADNRVDLVSFVRERMQVQPVDGASRDAQATFDPNTLTLGFARRFTEYKRPNLLLHDSERLVRILTNPQRPVQLIVAGKAHPEDEPGKAMVRAWVRFARRPEVHKHVIFLSDYDLLLAERLVQGVDVWINTPRRPWEACGTSGMKVLVNGGLNLSELDGWWAEAYSPEVGWSLGDRGYHGADPLWDAAEADDLYSILEREVIPSFYDRNDVGIPSAWVAKIRASMSRLTPQFSANRAVREYTERYYLPAAQAYRKRAKDSGILGRELLRWQEQIRQHWPAIYFGNVHAETSAGQHLFHVQVYLDELDPDAVAVELYADVHNGGAPQRHLMTRGDQLVGASKGWIYAAQVPATRPAEEFTARLIPRHPDAAIPLETTQIKWQR